MQEGPANKYISELVSEKKAWWRASQSFPEVLKYRFWGIIPGDPHSDLTGFPNFVLKLAKWFWCIMPKLGTTGLGRAWDKQKRVFPWEKLFTPWPWGSPRALFLFFLRPPQSPLSFPWPRAALSAWATSFTSMATKNTFLWAQSHLNCLLYAFPLKCPTRTLI